MSTEHGSTGQHTGWAYSLDASDDEARAALAADRVWNSFALADLRPPLREYTQVAVANHSRSGLAAACLVVRHPAFVVVSPSGAPDGVAALLERIELPRAALIQALEAHLPIIARFYQVRRTWTSMLRMAASADSFQPPKTAGSLPAVRLGPSDLVDMRALYDAYPGNHFRDDLLATGLFYGVRDQSALVAIGGTHVTDKTDGIAVLGNIFTHPAHRGRGHAHAITAALVSYLLRRNFKDVVLNVLADNSPAIRVYRDLGFSVAHRYLTGEAERTA